MAAAARRVLATIHVQLAFYQTQELFQAKDYRRARPAFEVAVEAAPEDPVARYNLACTRARTGAADEALASLARALELGLPHLLQLETDPDLASLRARPGFAPLLERARALAATPGK
jgi:tetratricopeptide (TPR) repeat protein